MGLWEENHRGEELFSEDHIRGHDSNMTPLLELPEITWLRWLVPASFLHWNLTILLFLHSVL